GAVSTSGGRLDEATLPEPPFVRIFSPSAPVTQDGSASDAPRCRHEASSLVRASATNRALSTCLIWKILAGSAATASHACASSASQSGAPASCVPCATRRISLPTQLGP